MENIKWIFDGIGTEIVSLIMGLVIGGGIGFKVGVHKQAIRQSQKAGDNARQTQIGQINER